MANELWIYDVIGSGLFEQGVTDKDVRDEMAKFKKNEPITVRINSPGGSAPQALAICNMLEEWGAGVNVKIDGQAASAASVIAMVGDTIEIVDGGWVMIHNASWMVAGGADDFRRAAKFMDELNVKIAERYAKRTGVGVTTVQKMMADETWLISHDAISQGFADKLSGDEPVALAIPEVFNFKNAPNPAAPLRQRPANRLAAMQRQLDLTRAAFGV